MKIAILGAGKVGTAIARVALAVGHEVTIAGSGSPDGISLLVSVLAPGAAAESTAEAVDASDLVILSIPAPKFATLDPALLAGRIVVDATNYWPDTDGDVPELGETASSERIAEHLRGPRLVKTLNHIEYHELERDRRPAGAADRRALAIVSDFTDAAAVVAGFIDSIGFDSVVATPLRRGRLIQPGTEIFAGAITVEALVEALDVPAGAAQLSSLSV